MANFQSFAEDVKQELEHIETISSGYGSQDESALSLSQLNEIENRTAVLEEFDRSVRKITENLSGYRENGSGEEIISTENDLADSLACLYLRTDEINEKLTELLLRSKTSEISDETRGRLKDLRGELVDFHQDLGEMARTAVRYGCLKAEASNMKEMVDLSKTVEHMWGLYREMEDGMNEPDDHCQDLQLLEPRPNSWLSWKGTTVFLLGMLASAVILLILLTQVIETHGKFHPGQCSDWYWNTRSVVDRFVRRTHGAVPF